MWRSFLTYSYPTAMQWRQISYICILLVWTTTKGKWTYFHTSIVVNGSHLETSHSSTQRRRSEIGICGRSTILRWSIENISKRSSTGGGTMLTELLKRNRRSKSLKRYLASLIIEIRGRADIMCIASRTYTTGSRRN